MVAVQLVLAFHFASGQELKLNKLEYFETQGVNVLVYNNLFTGGFNDEKNATRIEDAVKKALAQGYRTADIFTDGCRKVKCSEMGDAVVAAL